MQALPNGAGDVIVAGGRGLVVTSLDANLIRARRTRTSAGQRGVAEEEGEICSLELKECDWISLGSERPR